jgi:hypothetical protein
MARSDKKIIAAQWVEAKVVDFHRKLSRVFHRKVSHRFCAAG